jgi:geranylgeranyl diphosphate synthase, type II
MRQDERTIRPSVNKRLLRTPLMLLWRMPGLSFVAQQLPKADTNMNTEYMRAEAADDLYSYVKEARPLIEDALLRYLPVIPVNTDCQFNDAMHCAVFSGGKRLRPVLTLLGVQVVGGRLQDFMPAVAAVEYIHTSSLIFDDLPGMDNAALRRERACLHTQYGEGLAMLVALALLNASYGLVLDGCVTSHERAIPALGEMIDCIGVNGMVGGQTVDLALSRASRSAERRHNLEAARNLKTSALFRFALKIGAILCGATRSQLNALSSFAELLGTAYQKIDDWIDADEDSLGRMAALGGETVDPLDEEQLKRQVAILISDAKATITAEFSHTRYTRILLEFADYIAGRATHLRLAHFAS